METHTGISIINEMDSKALAIFVKKILINHSPQDIAILSRVHFLLDKLSEELTGLNIPHVKIGRKTALVESEEFRKFHAFLKLLINQFDNFSFLLIRDLIGVSREEYNKIRLQATQEGKSHFKVWDWENKEIGFFELCRDEEVTFDEIISLIDEIKFPFAVIDIYDTKEFALKWGQEHPNGTITEYLDWLATYDIQDEIEEDHSDKVQLMTIHAAKGLEFPVVIVAGCNEGILPGKQAINSGEVEEERRLFYVAMTRAKDNLILTVRPEKKEDEFGRVHESPVSRFINEMEG